MKNNLFIYNSRFLNSTLMYLFILIISISVVNGLTCYQETANESNINDGKLIDGCILDYNGYYSTPELQVGTGYMEVSYNKPIDSIGAVWNSKIGLNQTLNLSIPNDCYNTNTTSILLKVRNYIYYPNGFTPSQAYQNLLCYNGSNYNTLYSNGTTTTEISAFIFSSLGASNMYDADWLTSGFALSINNPSYNYWSINTTSDNNVTQFALFYEESITWSMNCTEQWITNDTICNGYNYTIGYYDLNNCETINDLPIDNGTIENCNTTCDWTRTIESCTDGVRLIEYTTSIVNCTEPIPINNGTNEICNNIVINQTQYPEYYLPFLILFIMLIIVTILGFIKPTIFYMGALILGFMFTLSIYYKLDNVITIIIALMILVYVVLATTMIKMKN